MILIILIILIIQTILISGLLYLKWKETPLETQQEIKRQIQPPKTEIKEWEPEQSQEEKAFQETLKRIKK